MCVFAPSLRLSRDSPSLKYVDPHKAVFAGEGQAGFAIIRFVSGVVVASNVDGHNPATGNRLIPVFL